MSIDDSTKDFFHLPYDCYGNSNKPYEAYYHKSHTFTPNGIHNTVNSRRGIHKPAHFTRQHNIRPCSPALVLIIVASFSFGRCAFFGSLSHFNCAHWRIKSVRNWCVAIRLPGNQFVYLLLHSIFARFLHFHCTCYEFIKFVFVNWNYVNNFFFWD